MAKSAFSIWMDFSKANKQADKPDEIASKVEKVAKNDMTNCRGTLSNGWKGDNATAYLKKMQIVEGDLASNAVNLRKIAKTIRQVAANTYKAEMAALRIAQTKKN